MQNLHPDLIAAHHRKAIARLEEAGELKRCKMGRDTAFCRVDFAG
jgi:hypothetical protein